ALVHEQRIGFPGTAGRSSTQMVDATFLERRHPRNLTAVVKMAIEEQPFICVIDHLRSALLQIRWKGHVRDRHDCSALEPNGPLVEHSRIDMHGDPPALLHDRVDRLRQRGHVIPVSMTYGNALDLAQPNSEIGAIANEDGAFGSG